MSVKVSFYTIPWARPAMLGQESEFVGDALRSGWISGGPYVERFEQEFAARLRTPCAVTVSSGTAALFLALKAAGIGPGDEVIVPGFTFVAPVNMVLETGARPVFADIDPLSWGISPSEVERLVTPKTKAVIPVHLYGNVCDVPALQRTAGPRGILVIEDTAQAAFSSWEGKPAGTRGEFGCFSFHATKTIAMGEGGCVVCRDDASAAWLRTLRDHGMREGKRYWHDVRGYNFRLTNLQAALGCAQLEYADHIIAERRSLYAMYRRHLRDVPGLTFQRTHPEADTVPWTLPVKLDPSVFRQGRERVMARLSGVGIETRPGFFPFQDMPGYEAPELPAARDVAMNVLCLPFYVGLTEGDVVFICDQLKETAG